MTAVVLIWGVLILAVKVIVLINTSRDKGLMNHWISRSELQSLHVWPLNGMRDLTKVLSNLTDDVAL